ncbi:linear amide C-N hydrolase [Photobacterium rosenbergii]|uniref:Linear amide C-N hydrolase n=1 Tax=Photobacterium rosenbergii TaxID=294936 RepID=A0ABU3ZJW7_9GAMM|nr:linear amide C-N hydrolase [Photobacterium rosenbergii]MDV5170418.1 linear amide C-N hydrolase [Photobacterium rosenbergii]
MCTRIFNNQNEDYLTTARNMDWAEQLPTSLYTFKSGLEKSGESKPSQDTLTWTSRYDSVVSMVVGAKNETDDFAASDGMNSVGLVANALYDSNADYKRQAHQGQSYKKLDVLRWVQYVLDTCCSVKAVVDKFNESSKIELVGSDVPSSDKPATLHLSVSDVIGDSAIIEVVDGEFQVHLSPSFQVMTNEPSYNQQLSFNQYWRWQWSESNSFPSHTIPGGPFPTDRFERASFNMHHLTRPDSMAESLAQSKSVIMNASVPIGFDFGTNDHPNIAPTLWSTISSQNELKYYFCNARTTGACWIDLANLDSDMQVAKVNVITLDNNEFINHPYDGLINNMLSATDDPFALPDENHSSSRFKNTFDLV